MGMIHLVHQEASLEVRQVDFLAVALEEAFLEEVVLLDNNLCLFYKTINIKF